MTELLVQSPLHESLLSLYSRGQLARKTTAKDGTLKAIAYSTLLAYYTQPISQRLKPFTHTFYPDTADKDQKDKYQVSILNLQNESVDLRFKPAIVGDDLFYASVKLDTVTDTWKVETFTDSDFSESTDLPYSIDQLQGVHFKALKHGLNLPILAMYKNGKISQKNLLAIMLSYVRHSASKHLHKLALDENGSPIALPLEPKKFKGEIVTDTLGNTIYKPQQYEKTALPVEGDTIRFIARILFDAMSKDSSALCYSMKDYLDRFLSINWALIADHIELNSEVTATGLLSLPGSEDPNMVF